MAMEGTPKRKRVADALRANEGQFLDLYNTTPAMMHSIDRDARLVSVNDYWLKALGYTRDEVLGHPLTEFMTDASRQYAHEVSLPRFYRDGFVMDVPLQFVKKNGDVIETLLSATTVSDDAGNFLRSMAVITDITERKRAEDALRESEARYRAVVESQTELICRFLPDTTLTFVNDAYCDYFGKKREELIGQSFLTLIPEDGHPVVWEHVNSLMANPGIKKIEYEHEVLLPHGNIGWQQWIDHAIVNSQGHVIEFQSVGRDITERKRAQGELENALSEVARLKDQLQAENIYLREEIDLRHNFGEIIGQNKGLKKVLLKVEQVAATDATVLIHGETGTGKELLARAVHGLSQRKDRALVKVNCAALPPGLIESELFGHAKGAFTGAVSKQVGRFELANGATMLLDEIGELPLNLQAKLLRVLQEGEFERLGSPRTFKVDVRIIATTNRDLEQAVHNGEFRQDLYHRLNVFPLTLPPLRERRDDIPPLVQSFVRRYGQKLGKAIDTIPQPTMTALQEYSWPGNIRELENVIERAVIVTQGTTLRMEDVLDLSQAAAATGRQTLEDIEREHIDRILQQTQWRIEGRSGAAVVLGLKAATLRSRMQKLGIRRPH